jgi:hypothetical protein
VSHRIRRLGGAGAIGFAAVAAATMGVVVPAGATGSTPTALTITVNGADSSASTTSPVSTLAWAGLPGDATGTVQFASGATVLCTAVLPATSCSSVSLAAGSYPGITGVYSGDGTYAGSTSTNSVDLTVGAVGGSSLTCRKIFGHVTSQVVVAKCGSTQKSAHFAGGDILTGGTLTWGKSATSTTYSGSATSPGQGTCRTGTVEYEFTGSVTAGTSTLASVGDAVSYDVCINSRTHVVALLLGSTASL